MNCLVTGGSGFLGSHVADELTNRGHNVLIFDEKKTKWKRRENKMDGKNKNGRKYIWTGKIKMNWK